MVTPSESQPNGSRSGGHIPAITQGRSYFDGVHSARPQGSATPATPSVTSRPAFDPDAFEEQTLRNNDAILALFQGRRNSRSHSHQSNRYPPFYQGNGTYTHVDKPQQWPDSQLSRGANMELAPVGYLNGRASRSARKVPPYLPQDVTTAFKKLRESLIHEEKLDMRDPSYKPLQGLPVPDQEATNGGNDTTMGGMNDNTVRPSNTGSASTSRRNSIVTSNGVSQRSNAAVSATTDPRREPRTIDEGERSWRVPSPIDTRDLVTSDKRRELRERRRASIETLVHPSRAPLVDTNQVSPVDTTPAPLVDTSRDPRKRRGA